MTPILAIPSVLWVSAWAIIEPIDVENLTGFAVELTRRKLLIGLVSAGPLREGTGTTFEGGQRVPCVMRGPGIPAGSVCNELTGTIDILPTIAALTGKPLPKGRKIDGLDVSGLWKGTAIKSPREEFLHYTSRGTIEGLRSGNWKLLVKKPRRNNAAKAQVLLFDLSKDVGEKNNLAEAKPDIVKKLRARMEALDAEITENARRPWFKN